MAAQAARAREAGSRRQTSGARRGNSLRSRACAQDLARARDPTREADLRARREAAIRDLETARAARAKLETAQSQLAALTSQREIAASRLADAKGYQDRLAEAEARLATLEDDLAAQVQAEGGRRRPIAQRRQRPFRPGSMIGTLRNGPSPQAEAAQSLAEAAQARAEARGVIATLRESLAEIDRLRTELHDKRAAREQAITGHPRAARTPARAAHDKVMQIRARLEAQAPRLAVLAHARRAPGA